MQLKPPIQRLGRPQLPKRHTAHARPRRQHALARDLAQELPIGAQLDGVRGGGRRADGPRVGDGGARGRHGGDHFPALGRRCVGGGSRRNGHGGVSCYVSVIVVVGARLPGPAAGEVEPCCSGDEQAAAYDCADGDARFRAGREAA